MRIQVGHCKAQQMTCTKIAGILQIKQKGMVSIPYSTFVPSTPCLPGPVCPRFIPCPSFCPNPPLNLCSVSQVPRSVASGRVWPLGDTGWRKGEARIFLCFPFYLDYFPLFFCFRQGSGLTICFLVRFLASSTFCETNCLN